MAQPLFSCYVNASVIDAASGLPASRGRPVAAVTGSPDTSDSRVVVYSNATAFLATAVIGPSFEFGIFH